MKRVIALLSALLLLLSAGCGRNRDNPPTADLQMFYNELEQEFGWDNLVPTEGEMLESYYPGL